jgi:hypothetical protein
VWEKSPGRVPVGAEVDVGDGSRWHVNAA